MELSMKGFNPFMPGGNKKVTHTLTNLQLLSFLLPPGIKWIILCGCTEKSNILGVSEKTNI